MNKLHKKEINTQTIYLIIENNNNKYYKYSLLKTEVPLNEFRDEDMYNSYLISKKAQHF